MWQTRMNIPIGMSKDLQTSEKLELSLTTPSDWSSLLVATAAVLQFVLFMLNMNEGDGCYCYYY